MELFFVFELKLTENNLKFGVHVHHATLIMFKL